MHSELSEDVLVVQIRAFLIERRRNGIFSWPLSYLLHATVAYGHSLRIGMRQTARQCNSDFLPWTTARHIFRRIGKTQSNGYLLIEEHVVSE
jgi:hypothetical protein